MHKTSDYEIGEHIIDKTHDYGRIVSIMDHPGLRQQTFFLLFNPESGFTILVSASDAVCDPWIARYIPKEVLKRFLFDAFIGIDLPDVPGTGPRSPVLTVPTYPELKPRVKAPPVVTGQIPQTPVTDKPQDDTAVPVPDGVPPTKRPMLPTIDWP